MKAALLVALGGALGSVARYSLSAWALRYTLDWRFPAGTFAVNIIGCLLAGLLAGVAASTMSSDDARLLLFTGLLGGFTTFSPFGLETSICCAAAKFWRRAATSRLASSSAFSSCGWLSTRCRAVPNNLAKEIHGFVQAQQLQHGVTLSHR